MQINNNGITTNTNSNGTSGSKAAAEKVADKLSNHSSDSQNDSVELSSQARVLTGLEAKISSVSDVDNGRVEQIKAAINSGEYTVNAEQIAAKLLANDDLF